MNILHWILFTNRFDLLKFVFLNFLGKDLSEKQDNILDKDKAAKLSN